MDKVPDFRVDPSLVHLEPNPSPDPSITTAAASTDGANTVAANTGFGFAGVIIFIIVVIIIIVIRKRYKDDEDLEDDEYSYDSDEAEENAERVQMRLFGDRKSRFDVTKCISDYELLSAIENVTISVTRISLCRQLGKGRQDKVHV